MAAVLASAESDWESRLHALLPVFGHRNWIVVADSAYPAQSRPGIETIVSGEDQIQVVRKTIDEITASKHVRANVYIDAELAFVNESDAPGINDYRSQLEASLFESVVTRIPHEQIIHKLDQFAQLFRIFIIKSEMTLPYTSVFFELDCGYWDAESEQRLRDALQASGSK